MLQPLMISADPLPFTPDALKVEGEDQKVVFQIPPLSQLDEERVGYELFRHGISPITDESFRAYFVQEVIDMYGDKADEMCDLLEELWQTGDVHVNNMAMWEAQEDQRRYDEAHGAEGLVAEPMPKHPMPLTRRHKAVILAQEVQDKSQKIRDLHVEKQLFKTEQEHGIVRILMAGWKGLQTPFEKEDGIIPLETYAALRGEIGKLAMRQLVDYVMTNSLISETERGNSDSPPESESPPNSLPAPNDGSESSDGSSTSEATDTPAADAPSSSTPIPEEESAKTIDGSSTSTSPSTGETSSTDDTQGQTPSQSPAD